MINFKQKVFSEFDAMRSLYVELTKNSSPNKFQIIKVNSLLPILKGNNVVIERFVVSTGFFKKDTYRMYLKIGAKAKMPDEVRLPQKVYDRVLFNTTVKVGFNDKGQNGGFNNNNNDQQQSQSVDKSKGKGKGSDKEKTTLHSETFTSFREKLFGKGKGGDGGGPNGLSSNLFIPINIQQEVTKLLGEAVDYDKKSRSLVLEFDSIHDAIYAINILPFGINYKIYLLDINS